jgi:hypothetical protein
VFRPILEPELAAITPAEWVGVNLFSLSIN